VYNANYQNYRFWKNSKLVRLESRNEQIEDFNEEMEWDASERLWDMQSRLWDGDNISVGDYYCSNWEDGNCYRWFSMWVAHCPDCGSAVLQEQDEPL
jgi:hypothetical protein